MKDLSIGKGERFFSDKKHVVLLVLFIIAFITAIVFITIGVQQIGKDMSGYHVVFAENDEDLPFYDAGITFTCYLTGNGSEIKAQQEMIGGAYSAVLRKTFKMFGSDALYEDTVNLASISKKPGKDVEVSYTLFSVLRDAYERTLLRAGYDLFAGAMNDLVRRLVNSSTAREADPSADAETAALLEDLRKFYSSPDTFRLTFDEARRTVRLDLSGDFSSFLEESGVDAPILDLGLLKNAYRLPLIAEELISKGYVDGVLQSDDGMTVVLPSYSRVDDYCLYSPSVKDYVMSATKRADVPGVCCTMRIFPLADSIGFYAVEKDGKTLLRHKYMTDFRDGTPVLSVMVKSGKQSDLVECAYTALSVLNAPDEQTALIRAAASPAPELIVDLNDGASKLFVRGAENTSVRKDFTTEDL